jgi:hypothetical protein
MSRPSLLHSILFSVFDVLESMQPKKLFYKKPPPGHRQKWLQHTKAQNTSQKSHTPKKLGQDIVQSSSGSEKVSDFFLDVPALKIDELKLCLDDLDARVTLHAELADIVTIEVGINLGIKKIDLDLKGVNAQAVLKVHLDQVSSIFHHVLDTLDNNPDFFTNHHSTAGNMMTQFSNTTQEKKTTTENVTPNSGIQSTISTSPLFDINKSDQNINASIEAYNKVQREIERYRNRVDSS